MTEILVSICLCGRNDNYGHDFKRRFTQAMNFLAWSAEKAGVYDKLEVVFCDWNSHIPLATELTLSPASAKMVRFIAVPPGECAGLNAERSPFHTGRSLNIAFRRARGKFIGMMPGDILLTRFSLHHLFHLLQGKWDGLPFDPALAILGIPRKNLAAYCSEQNFFDSNEAIERHLAEGDFYFSSDTFKSLMAGYGLFLLSRELMNTLGGLNEEIGGWGVSDTDIGLRAAAVAPVINLSAYGVCCYDFEADSSMRAEKSSRQMDESHQCRLAVPEDSANWGMPGKNFSEQTAGTPDSSERPDGAIPASPRKEPSLFELLWRVRFLDLDYCNRVSATALAVLEYLKKHSPEKVLLVRLPDPSVPMVLAAASPFSELYLLDGSPENLRRFLKCDYLLKELHHHAHVHCIPVDSFDFPASNHFDLIVLQEKRKEADFRPYLKENGNILSSEAVYGKSSGGFLSTLFPVGKLYKLCNILGRLNMAQWFAALKWLRKGTGERKQKP